LEGVFYLPDKPVLIGRADGVDIQLLDSRVSRRHAVIRESVAGYIIQDLDTKNGTFVNEEAIERSLLFHSDAIVIGGYTLKFLEEDEQDVSTSLDSGFVAPLPSEGLKVPRALAGRGPNPNARTSPRPGGEPPPRVNRLDRQRDAAAQKAREAVARAGQVAVDASDGPVVEAAAPGSARGRKANFTLDFSLSEFDSGGGDPDAAPLDTARQRIEDLRRGAQRNNNEVLSSPVRSGRPEIHEITDDGTGVRFKPDAGTTSCGFTDDDDVRIGDDGVGTLFTVRRRGQEIEVRAGSSLRPVLLNGSPVVSAEAFPGDVFEVGGRRFRIRLSVGGDAVPGAETKLGIDSAALEAAIQARLLAGPMPERDRTVDPALVTDRHDAVEVEAAPDSARPGSTAVAADNLRVIADAETLPRELIEADDEWVADSLRTAPVAISPAVAAANEGPPMVHENVVVEGVSVSDIPNPTDSSDDWLDSMDDLPKATDTQRTRAVEAKKRKKRAGGSKLPPPSFLPPITDSGD